MFDYKVSAHIDMAVDKSIVINNASNADCFTIKAGTNDGYIFAKSASDKPLSAFSFNASDGTATMLTNAKYSKLLSPNRISDSATYRYSYYLSSDFNSKPSNQGFVKIIS